MAVSLDSSMRHSVARAPVARLATIRPEGTPHLVAITFALTEEGAIVIAVDHKPKTTTHLQRLRNIAANPAVSVLVDHYEPDWSQLWWARADGRAQIYEEGDKRSFGNERGAAVPRIGTGALRGLECRNSRLVSGPLWRPILFACADCWSGCRPST